MKILSFLCMVCMFTLSATAWADEEVDANGHDEVKTAPAEQRAASKKAESAVGDKLHFFEQHGAETRPRAWYDRGPAQSRNARVMAMKRIVKASFDATKPMANEMVPLRK